MPTAYRDTKVPGIQVRKAGAIQCSGVCLAVLFTRKEAGIIHLCLSRYTWQGNPAEEIHRATFCTK